jgi:hypothetical protein
MQIACKEFLGILKQAEEGLGTSLPIDEIGKRMTRFPAGSSAAEVFELCKDQGWVMGTAAGPWLTPVGKLEAGLLP